MTYSSRRLRDFHDTHQSAVVSQGRGQRRRHSGAHRRGRPRDRDSTVDRRSQFGNRRDWRRRVRRMDGALPARDGLLGHAGRSVRSGELASDVWRRDASDSSRLRRPRNLHPVGAPGLRPLESPGGRVGQDAVLPHGPDLAGARVDERACRHQKDVRQARRRLRSDQTRRSHAQIPANEPGRDRLRAVHARHGRAEGSRRVRGRRSSVRKERWSVRHREGELRPAVGWEAGEHLALDGTDAGGSDVCLRTGPVAAQAVSDGGGQEAEHAATRRLLLRDPTGR